jgi:cysteine desulfuration protein SufE
MDVEELKENFALLDDWSDRYRYIIELGKSLPEMNEGEKTAETKVLGCQSQVWLVGEPDATSPAHLRFRADSDAHIVRGLVAVVLMIFEGKTAAEIAELDPRPLFKDLGLDTHLSQGRSNGLLSMVGRIKDIAARYRSAVEA